MANIDDIEIPTLLFDEQASDPATPGTGLWRAFFKSDGLYVIDDAGTVTGPFGVGGGSAPSVAVDRVETQETTTTGTYTDLATSGPAVTVTVTASGVLQVSLGAGINNDNLNGGAMMGFTLSGANTLAADDARGIGVFLKPANGYRRMGRTFVLTGLSSGSTTVTAKYRRAAAGSAIFEQREISAMVGLVAA